MVRLITTLLLCLFVGITANASQITEQQALQVAAKYADIRETAKNGGILCIQHRRQRGIHNRFGRRLADRVGRLFRQRQLRPR